MEEKIASKEERYKLKALTLARKGRCFANRGVEEAWKKQIRRPRSCNQAEEKEELPSSSRTSSVAVQVDQVSGPVLDLQHKLWVCEKHASGLERLNGNLRAQVSECRSKTLAANQVFLSVRRLEDEVAQEVARNGDLEEAAEQSRAAAALERCRLKGSDETIDDLTEELKNANENLLATQAALVEEVRSNGDKDAELAALREALEKEKKRRKKLERHARDVLDAVVAADEAAQKKFGVLRRHRKDNPLPDLSL